MGKYLVCFPLKSAVVNRMSQYSSRHPLCCARLHFTHSTERIHSGCVLLLRETAKLNKSQDFHLGPLVYFSYVCAHLYMPVLEVCAHVCEHIDMQCCCSECHPSCVLRQGLAFAWSLLIWFNWLARYPQGSSWLYLSSAGITSTSCRAQIFYFGSED